MNILFISSTRIGDAVLSTGLLQHLIEKYEDAHFTIASGSLPAPLFKCTPRVLKRIALVKQPFSLHWLSLWKNVVGTAWDLVVDLRGSGLAWTLVAKKRRVLQSVDDGLHRVEALANFMELPDPPSPKLWWSGNEENYADEFMNGATPIIAIGPTANWAAKIWPADRFISLLNLLTAKDGILPGARVAVLGGEDERYLALPILNSIPPERCIDLVGSVDILSAAACLSRCQLFIGNDSGLMHLSAATGVPTLGLFGPSPPINYAPWGSKCAVAKTEIPYEKLVGAPDFDHLDTQSLMTSLTVENATIATIDLWNRSQVK